MQQSQEALLIFVRSPQLGKVKTRLAATLGAEKALAIYQRLLAHTLAVSTPLPVEKYVFFEGSLSGLEAWSSAGVQLVPQQGQDLGERLIHAFQHCSANGHQKLVVIGSDCGQLQTHHLQSAFGPLAGAEPRIVLGPAQDGGYYLLGTNGFHESLFQGIAWSTDQVAAQTLKAAQKLGLTASLLPMLNDVDEEKDLPPGWL